jgi:hypothetical protein
MVKKMKVHPDCHIRRHILRNTTQDYTALDYFSTYKDVKGRFGQQIRNTWKVLKCGAGEGWRRSVGPIM